MTHVYPFTDEGSDRIRSQVFDKRAATEAPSAAGGGSGDVVGPASSTADAVALFDGLTGKLLKDSAKTFIAANLPITDAGAYFTGTDVEAALQEIGADLASLGGGSSPTVTWDSANASGNLTLSGSDLIVTKTAAGGAHSLVRANVANYNDGLYFEVEVTADDANRFNVIGVSDPDDALTNHVGQSANSVGIYGPAGELYKGGVSSGSYGSFTTGDVIGVAYRASTGKIWFAKNNTWLGSGDPAADKLAMATTVAGMRPAVSIYSGSSVTTLEAHFKASDQTYSPPTGFTPWDAN